MFSWVVFDDVDDTCVFDYLRPCKQDKVYSVVESWRYRFVVAKLSTVLVGQEALDGRESTQSTLDAKPKVEKPDDALDLLFDKPT